MNVEIRNIKVQIKKRDFIKIWDSKQLTRHAFQNDNMIVFRWYDDIGNLVLMSEKGYNESRVKYFVYV